MTNLSSKVNAEAADNYLVCEETYTENSEEIPDGGGTDFAAQLRKHRKQVLDKGDDSTDVFANALRRHREHLVDAWEDNHVEQNAVKDDANEVVNYDENKGLNDFTEFGTGLAFNFQTQSEDNGENVVIVDSDANSLQPNYAQNLKSGNNGSNAADHDDFGALKMRAQIDVEKNLYKNDVVEKTKISALRYAVSNGDTDTDFRGSDSPKKEKSQEMEEESDEDKIFGDPGISLSPSGLHTHTDMKDNFRIFEESQTLAIEMTPGMNGQSEEIVLPNNVTEEQIYGDTLVKDQPNFNANGIVGNDGDDRISFDQAQISGAKTPIEDNFLNSIRTDPEKAESPINANEYVRSQYVNQNKDYDDDVVGFSDIGAAPSLVAQSDDGEDDEFDAAPSQPELLDNSKEGKDAGDDDFGDFGVAPTTLVAQSVDKDRNEDDAFGDFDAAPTLTAQSAEEDDSGGDVFGDFNAAISQPESLDNANNDIATDDDNDDFGDYGASPALVDRSVKEDHNEDDDFSGFDAAPIQPESLVNANKGKTEDDDNDDYEDLGAAPALTARLIKEDHSEDDTFGDFDASPIQPESLDDANKDNTEDDDNGDYGAAPALASRSVKEDDVFGDFDATPIQPKPFDNGNKEKTEGDDSDEFGDFGVAPALVAQSAKEDKSEDDVFGDFGAAPSQCQVSNIANEDKAEDDEDSEFGDLGVAPALVAQSAEEDDVFGDFGAAPLQCQLSNTANDDKAEYDEDNHFGDFGAAPTLVAQPAEEDDNGYDGFSDFDSALSQPEPSNSVNDDQDVEEDNDFGDFGAAPVPAVQSVKEDGSKSDAFGRYEATSATIKSLSSSSFSRRDENFGHFDNLPGRDTPLPPIGRVAHGKRNIFAKMQALHSFLSDPDRLSGISDDTCVDEEGLNKFLAFSRSVEVNDRFQEHDDLYQLLRDSLIQTKAVDSRTVVKDDGRGPYNSYVYPLTGFRAPHREFDNERQLQRNLSVRAIPEVLPIRLPSGKETPLDTASPVTFRDRNKMSKDSIKAVQIPNLDVPKVGKGSLSEKFSEDVQKFRSKIPDLSFMLQSYIILPANTAHE